MIFYFSGCGNSRYVAESIAAGLNDTLVFIPEAAREGHYDYTLAEAESLGFVFPIYAWGPAKLVLDFVKKLSIKTGPSTDLYWYARFQARLRGKCQTEICEC